MIFQSCIEDGDYLCPYCDHSHKAQELWPPCNDASLKQYSVYASLQGQQGLLLLHMDGPLVRFHAVAQGGWRASEPENAVILPNDDAFFLFRYDTAQHQWRRDSEPLRQYQRVGENLYAIVL